MALMKCPECGENISMSASVCPHCGLPFQKEETPPHGRSTKNKISTWLFIIIVIAAFLLGGAACFFAFGLSLRDTSAVTETKSIFEQQNGSLFLPPSMPIKNDYLNDEQKDLIDKAMRESVKLCNALLFMPDDIKVDLETFGREVMELTSDNSFDTIQDADLYIGGKSPITPARMVSSKFAGALLSGTGEFSEFSSGKYYVTILPESRESIIKATLAALAYYYESDPEPYLMLIGNSK